MVLLFINIFTDEFNGVWNLFPSNTGGREWVRCRRNKISHELIIIEVGSQWSYITSAYV